ncbi:two-component sensor histidine kinase [Saccharothrix sp. 6-C]|uniref:sensor histidine kinase n=1 Tax=Saccharothrix sp. 6-C TaxID=2781735 RepID=UPI001916EB3F|nr:histidine kinase [Saccharothrix sp. 6-C]QQQ79366.1 two-component sensor histidine kinase [Saccharothrix sp. 6-C]
MTWRRFAPAAADVALALGASAMDVVLYSHVPLRPEEPDFWFALWYLGLVSAVLVARRRHPMAVFVVVLAVAALASPVSGFAFRPEIAVYLALFTVAERCRVRVAGVALAGALLYAFSTSTPDLDPGGLEDVLVDIAAAAYLTLLPLSVWATGRWVRTSREHARALEERRQLEARQAVAEERGRIARELHDVVSHAVTVIVLQAAGGRRVLDRDPTRAARAFDTIQHLGENAMGELRRMLEVLRAEGEPAEPQPGAGDIPALLDSFRAAGLHVESRVTGDPRPVEPAVDLAVYRVVQEALTNVTKHAGPGASAEVLLTWTATQVEIRVGDAGGPRAAHRGPLSTGHGLIGLRERLAALGGSLSTARTPTGGFRLDAVLPLDSAGPAVDQPPPGPVRRPEPGVRPRRGRLAESGRVAVAGVRTRPDEEVETRRP